MNIQHKLLIMFWQENLSIIYSFLLFGVICLGYENKKKTNPENYKSDLFFTKYTMMSSSFSWVQLTSIWLVNNKREKLSKNLNVH